MYRCLICQKPFVSFKTIVDNDGFGDYFVSVTPCCESHDHSQIEGYSFTTVSGSTGTFRQLSANEAIELGLNWAIDFYKEQQ